MRHAVLAVLFVGFLCAQSQPPVPAPLKSAQNNKTKAAGKQAVAANNQSDTKSVASAINELTAEVASWKKQSNSSPEKSTPPVEWWPKASTIVSAAATFGIAVLSGFQARIIHKQRQAMEQQVGYMRDGLTETQKAANAADASAKAASGTLVVIQGQADLTRQSAKAAMDNATAARDSASFLLNSERAWIDITIERDWHLLPSETGRQVVYFAITNHGRTIAFLTGIYSRFHIHHKGAILPETPAYTFQDILHGRKEPMVPGKALDHIPIEGETITASTIEGMRKGDLTLFVYAKVTSEDYTGRPHQTQICYAFKFSQTNYYGDGFDRAGGEQYNQYT